MFFAGSGVSVLRGSWSYCMNTRFQYSRKRSFSPPGRSSALPNVERRGRGRARCTARTARSGRPARSSPSAGTATIRSRGTPIDSQASIASSSGPRPSSSSPSKTVTQMSLGVQAEALERQVPGELDRALLEVVADREVAEHLEERQVPRGRADLLDVGRAEELLAASSGGGAAAARGRRKYGLSGCMPAMMSSVDGSNAAGPAAPTAGAGGRAARRTTRNCSRISSGMRGESQLRSRCGDRPAADDDVAAQQARRPGRARRRRRARRGRARASAPCARTGTARRASGSAAARRRLVRGPVQAQRRAARPSWWRAPRAGRPTTRVGADVGGST